MDIDKMIREITEETLKSLRAENTPALFTSRDSSSGRSAYDMGPCATEMYRETRKESAFDGNYSSRVNNAARSSAYDYQTHR